MHNLALSLTSSAVAGALTLVSPADWSPGVRRAYVLVPGIAVAAGGALLLSRRAAGRAPAGAAPAPVTEEAAPPARRPTVAARTALLLGLGAATCGIQASSLWIDAVLERWLVGRGAAHPRRWIAALAVLASLGMDVVGDRVSTLAEDGRRPPS